MGFPAECLEDFNRDPNVSLPVLSNLLTHSPDRALPVSCTETRSGLPAVSIPVPGNSV